MKIVKNTLLLVMGCQLLGLSSLQAQQKKKTNVLFILVDDLRPNLGCYGDGMAITPNIDKLAQQGVTFSRAYCQQAVCNPSRASMLTGLRPDENGVVSLETHFRNKVPDLITLPQAFKNNGYFTVGTGKIFHPMKGKHDLESWSDPVDVHSEGSYILPENQGKGLKKGAVEVADVADDAYSDGKIADDAVALLNKATTTGKPFFLAVGFKKPHAPFCMPKKYWDMYADNNFEVSGRERPKASPDIAYHDWQEMRGYTNIPKSGPIPSEKEQELIRAYYACISYVDAQVGKVIDELDRLGLRENTVVVLWGDHGYHLGEQDLWCKSTNFELDARVPLIIDAPEATGSKHISRSIVETVDIYPTLLDICRLAPNSNLSGTSMKDILMDHKKEGKGFAFSQFVRPYNAIFNNKPTHMGYSLRTDKWRCTYWYDLENNTIAAKELYRMKGDKPEQENVSGKSSLASEEAKLAEMISKYKEGEYKKIIN